MKLLARLIPLALALDPGGPVRSATGVDTGEATRRIDKLLADDWRQHKLAPKWQTKIAMTRARDQRNFRRLRRCGWTVLRIWEHEVEYDASRCLSRILAQLLPQTEEVPSC